MSFLIIAKDGYCPNCNNAKNFLTSKGLKFEVKVCPTEVSYQDACNLVGIFKEFPSIAYNGERVGGFQELIVFVNENYDKLEKA